MPHAPEGMKYKMNDQDNWNRLFRRRHDCPSPEALDHHLSLETNEREKDDVATHIRSCANCKTEIALLKRFSSGEISPTERDDVATIVKDLETSMPNSGAA